LEILLLQPKLRIKAVL